MSIFRSKDDKVMEAALELALKNLSCNTCPFLDECSTDFKVSCKDIYLLKAREGYPPEGKMKQNKDSDDI